MILSLYGFLEKRGVMPMPLYQKYKFRNKRYVF